MKKRTAGILFGGLFLLLIALSVYGMFMPYSPTILVKPTVAPTQTQINRFSYKGETSKDALTLLKSQTSVEQDKSGLVVAIDGRKADNTKKEFWAFYVNGKEAQVGPASYQTKNGDKIDWKIMKY